MLEATRQKGQELNRFRGYLKLLARAHLSSRFQRQLDPSDIVQATLLRAYGSIEDLHARNDSEVAAWLRTILARNLANATRDLSCQRRDIRRESSLEEALEKSSLRLEAFLGSMEPSPASQLEKHEALERLAEALEQLPEPQREALVLQHWHGRSLDEISSFMGRSKDAVAGLVRRALLYLREELKHLE